MQTSGFFWHVHHDVLLEWSSYIRKRIEYIKDEKPVDQVEIRLRLMKPVQGELPAAVVEIGKACEDAWRFYWKTCDEAVWRAYDEAWQAYKEALKANAAVLNELHRKECPDCPWDGETIFPDK